MVDHALMIMGCLLSGMLLTTATSAGTDERFLLKFELIQDENIIERGRDHVSRESHTWSKGLQSSYLKLRCHQQKSGEMQKLYSTVDHFTGLRVTHQLAGDNVELTVVHHVVQPRLAEIRALARRECRDLSPIVTTTTQSYSLPAKDGMTESTPFSENMTFRATLQSLGKIR